MPSTEGEKEVGNVNLIRVSAKLPPFWNANPEIWFAQGEAQFIVAGITIDDTKFNHVIGNIDGKILARVSDVVVAPPATDKYSALKAAILAADSQQKKSSKLLAEVELGDRKPSELLNEMRILADNKVTDDFLRTLWSCCLPSNVSAILSTSDADLTGLARMVDKIMEVADFSNRISAVSSCDTSPSTLEGGINIIEKTFAKLSEQIKSISLKINTNHSRSRSRSRALAEANAEPGKCWYHRKFADKENRCIAPCTFNTTSKND
ncbi:PREDICTED: uncharacterized protein LOC108368130 [Rhagoletis zephyria]|uniref:uncharacterized protein LOC108368130 n=1 Tax=Rhagoletis zephyria TaxID=28612 RepID=UPI0008113020|nr:PREDICTED: uncharacterized protein LOC108368130 [Rhagoletis zephyria]